MLPVIVTIGTFAVGTHDFFVALGALAAILVFAWQAHSRRMLDDNLIWIAGAALLCGAAGAKLSTIWEYFAIADQSTLEGVLADGGRSILGGLAAAYGGAVLMKRVLRYRTETGDVFAPAVAVGMALGRWGCFLTEQVGTPTTLPWGIRLTQEQAMRIPECPAYCAAGVPMHPSFVYEIAFHTLAFVVLLRLRQNPHFTNQLLKLYLLGYGAFRFGVEFVRGNPVIWNGLTVAQLALVPAIAVLAVYFWQRRQTFALTPARA